MPAPDFCYDFVGVGGACEGFVLDTVLVEKTVHRGLEIDDGSEEASLQSLPCESDEESFDDVDPLARGWREVEGEMFVTVQPLAHLRMLVGDVFVEDHVDGLASAPLQGCRRLSTAERKKHFVLP